MEELNYESQDGTGLLGVCGKHPASDGTPGISAESTKRLADDLADASVKDTEQQKAVTHLKDCTAAQDNTMAKCAALIGTFRDAVHSQYEDDEAMKKKFHIGARIPNSVGGMKSELKYISSIAGDYKDILKKHGVTDEDFTSLDAFSEELDEADKEQENAKKAQKEATKARDLALKTLVRTKGSIRHDAKIIFKKQPLVLIEFEKMPPPPPGRKPKQPPSGQTTPEK